MSAHPPPPRHFQAAVNATSLPVRVKFRCAPARAGYGPAIALWPQALITTTRVKVGPTSHRQLAETGSPSNSVSGIVAIHGVSLNGVGITGGTKEHHFQFRLAVSPLRTV